jgi:hypothetical protein
MLVAAPRRASLSRALPHVADLDEIAEAHVRVERAVDGEHFRAEHGAIGSGGEILHAVRGARHVVARRDLFDHLKLVQVSSKLAGVLVPVDHVPAHEIVLQHGDERVEDQLGLVDGSGAHLENPLLQNAEGGFP